nr:hypothetical protein BaRGS_008727 [Batillaria attramentaria]
MRRSMMHIRQCGHDGNLCSEVCGALVMSRIPAKNSADSDTEAGSQTESEGKRKPFFNNPAYLTVSGQLHLEAVARITYSEAAALLQKRNDKFQFKVETVDFQAEVARL